MAMLAHRSLPSFVPDALAASAAGTWEYDVETCIIRCDAFVAAMHGLSAEEALNGVSADRFLQAVHPDDLARSVHQRESVRRDGGVYVFELRLRPRPGVVRWALVRGAFERGPDGGMRGRGILLDVTEGKLDGYAEGQAIFAGVSGAVSPLELATEHAIAAREAIDRIEAADGPSLRDAFDLRGAVDVLLLKLGRCLARRTAPRAG